MFKIGKLQLSFPLILAPLSGISDLPFRSINRSFGCELAFTEMISARALTYHNKGTESMLDTVPSDRPLGIQLVGADPDSLRRAMDILDNYDFDIIDFNAACPVHKVVKKGEGAGLLKDPKKLNGLLRIIVDRARVPVTVKIRAGWDEDTINAKEVALICQDTGIEALFIHGRTKMQGYSGNVSYQVIRDVKKTLRIPVIASGDALSPLLIKKMFEETGCDAVVVARGALGNPWIFRETIEYINSGVLPRRPDVDEVIRTMQEHLVYCTQVHGEVTGTVMFRKFFAWYSRGFRDVKQLREAAFRAQTRSQMLDLISMIKTASRGSSGNLAPLH